MRVISSVLVVFLLGVAALCQAQDELGRLFYTPDQRQALDAGKRIVVKSTRPNPPSRPKPKAKDLALHGVVTRSDGERTVWINEKAYHNTVPEGVSVRIRPGDPAVADVSIGTSGQSVEVKVGQEMAGETGTVRPYRPRDVEQMPSLTTGNTQPSTPGKKEPAGRASNSASEGPVVGSPAQ
jgi:hypothetical protein